MSNWRTLSRLYYNASSDIAYLKKNKSESICNIFMSLFHFLVSRLTWIFKNIQKLIYY